MGHQIGKRHRPKRGSKQFWPRVRAKRPYLRIKSYPNIGEVIPLAFAGYKAGMTQIIVIDNRKHSKTKGAEMSVPVTIVECPPLSVMGVRLYSDKRCVTEILSNRIDNRVKRKRSLPKKQSKLVEPDLTKIEEVRLVVHTNPVKKKKPEIFEIKLGGTVTNGWNKAKQLLGQQVRVKDVFKPGENVDVLAVTKGKGTQGSVKRFGVKLLSHKSEKLKRKIGSLGPWTPKRVLWGIPQYGQMGYHSRVEYNKTIMEIGEGGLEISGGITHYGVVKNDYVLIKGSVPGPKKRLIIFRKNIRGVPPIQLPEKVKVITSSQQ